MKVLATVATFMTTVGGLIGVVSQSLAVFMEPPVSYFVGLAAVGIGLKFAKGLIPRKK